MAARAGANIQFHYLSGAFHFPDRTHIKSFIRRLFSREGKKLGRLDYIFCDDAYLLEINKQFLSHNTYTDIITFPMSEPGKPITGEIYISIERIKENAVKYHTPFITELRRVMFHGALHLCGYKDKSAREMASMREAEDYYLSLFVSRGTTKSFNKFPVKH